MKYVFTIESDEGLAPRDIVNLIDIVLARRSRDKQITDPDAHGAKTMRSGTKIRWETFKSKR